MTSLQHFQHTPTRLFCFPYAGASAGFYNKWQARLSPQVELCPVELPGHGARMGQPLETTMPGLVEHLLPRVSLGGAPRFGLFGHSLGALVAYEVAHALRARSGMEPTALIVSGSSAPSMRDPARYSALSSDADLLAELVRLEGTPSSVLANAELMDLTLPIIRADFRICADYEYRPRPPLHCRILALGGDADASVTPGRLAAWRSHTTGDFSLKMLSGGHFFIRERESQLLDAIAHCFRSPASSTEAQART
jgi:surfactin synthase thioesterase subunit